MSKPTWIKPLSEVLKQTTQIKSFVSDKTGNEYTTDTIPELIVYSVSPAEETEDGKYKYNITDVKNDLQYTIKTKNRVDTNFGKTLKFYNVRGGALQNGLGWYAADSVELVQRSA